MKNINSLLEKRNEIKKEYNSRYCDYDYICPDVLYTAEKVIDVDNKIIKEMIKYIEEIQNASMNLVSQIEIGDYKNTDGYDLKMNDTLLNLKGILSNEKTI